MSKGMRNREANAEKQRLKLEKEKFEAKKRKVRKVTAIITFAVIAAFVLLMIGGAIVNSVRLNTGVYLRSEIAAASDNFEVDGAQMNYFLNDTYNTFLNYYGSYVTYYGLDPTISLKSQFISETQTWFDYFIEGAKSSVTNMLTLDEEATENGVALTDAEIEAINYRAKNMDKGLYGRGVNNGDIYNAKLLEALAYKYQYMKKDEFAPSKDDILAEYEANKTSYQSVDYLAFPIYYVADEEASSGEVTKFNLAKAEELAASLATATDEAVFKMKAKDILKLEDSSLSDEKLTEKTDSLSTAGALYTSGDELSEWAFAAKSFETKIIKNENTKTVTVYMLTKEAYLEEGKTINVRDILFQDAIYGSRKKALKAAEKVLGEFEASDKSADTFALLALKYSDDPGSYYNGALYECVAEGVMVESFNDWCFDEARKTGDYAIVETDYGCHIMYFAGDSDLVEWEAVAYENIIGKANEEFITEITKKHMITFNDELLSEIPG